MAAMSLAREDLVTVRIYHPGGLQGFFEQRCS